MSSFVTSILSSTVGLLWNKALDSTAAKLQCGDVTDAKIRELVVRELNDVKRKLDGLSRKDLLSSYDFLQEGVDLLNVSLDRSKLEQKALVTETQDNRGVTMPSGPSGPSGIQSAEILNEALELPQAMRNLKVNSDKEFETAQKRFEEARKAATHAFRIESLNIEDRIFAAKLRIVSEILECLESPETAIPGCLSFLKKLHGMPAIQEIFTVYLNKGVKSMLNKAERAENVKSVMLINYVLFKYVSKFSSKYSAALAWPTIELADRSFNPISSWQEVSGRKSMSDELTQLPNRQIFHDEAITPVYSAVNSHGDVVVGGHSADDITIISKTGETIVAKLPEPREGKVIKQYIRGITVDKDDNVYVVRRHETLTENGVVASYVLDVLDDNYNTKQDSYTFEFLEATYDYLARIAVNKNNDIIMIKCDDPHVYVCENTGKLKHKFERDSSYTPRLGISGQDEIMIPSGNNEAVQIYSKEGDLKSIINLPQGHKVCDVAFHYVIFQIIVLSYVEKNKSYFLLCYNEAGKLETSTFLYKHSGDRFYPQIKSHENGPVAVVREKSITFI